MNTLTSTQARRLALAAGAGFYRTRGRGPAAVADLVERIGYVQIDTISVVERVILSLGTMFFQKSTAETTESRRGAEKSQRKAR